MTSISTPCEGEARRKTMAAFDAMCSYNTEEIHPEAWNEMADRLDQLSEEVAYGSRNIKDRAAECRYKAAVSARQRKAREAL